MLSASFSSSIFKNLREGKIPLRIASRSSALAKAQVYECVEILKKHYPKLQVEVTTTTTEGDRDKATPLRLIENSDFFTKEIDDLVSQKKCHIAIHSAKDLPEPSNLPIVVITRCLHPADLLVYADRYSEAPFPESPILGSSSMRRTAILKKLFPSGKILDIRGTIEERLQQLNRNKYDAIVLAKAAALRLSLSLSNSKELPPPYHPSQGRLAITAYNFLAPWRIFLSPLQDPDYTAF